MALSSISKGMKVSARSPRHVSGLLARPAGLVTIRSSSLLRFSSLSESAYGQSDKSEVLRQQEQVQSVVSALDQQQNAPWWQPLAKASMRMVAVVGVAFALVSSLSLSRARYVCITALTVAFLLQCHAQLPNLQTLHGLKHTMQAG